MRAHQHGRRQPRREDDRLSGIEQRQRGIGLHAGALVALHRVVIPRGLALLGAEIFDGFVVQQRIDRLGIRFGIGVVHLAANLDPPFGRDVGVVHVDHHGDHGRQHIAPVELPQQHAHDQRDLDDGRHQLQDHHAHDDLDAEAAALQHPGQAAGLALQVKAQRQLMHVNEGAIGEFSDRMHRDLGEDAVAPLRQHRHQHAHRAVAQGHDQRRGDQPQRPVRRLHRSGIGAG